eukprot:1462068-Lingulodinium_polyedra.AAC.1
MPGLHQCPYPRYMDTDADHGADADWTLVQSERLKIGRFVRDVCQQLETCVSKERGARPM